MIDLRLVTPLLFCLGLGLAFGIAALHSPPEDLFDAAPAPPPVQLHLPGGTSRLPVVLLLEEPGPAAAVRYTPWVGWFLRHGFAVAQIRGDLGVAADLTFRQSRIDAEHFAVMGAGRQAMTALHAVDAFNGGPMPTAVFALNPPCGEACPHSYPAAGPTRVYILHSDSPSGLSAEIARSRVLATLALAWQID